MDVCSLALELEREIASQWSVHWGSVRDMGLGMRLVVKRVPWEIGLGQIWLNQEKIVGGTVFSAVQLKHQIAQRCKLLQICCIR